MSNDTRDISDILREASARATPEPPADLWERIGPAVATKPRRGARRTRRGIMAAWAVAASLLGFGVFVATQGDSATAQEDLVVSSLELDVRASDVAAAVRVDASWYEGLDLKDGTGDGSEVLRSCGQC